MPKSKSKEITLNRVYDAPLTAVWDAWTDPKKVALWWGPRGFTLTTHSKDLRAGGHWDYTMHGPDGTDYPNTTVYLEVDPMARLVYDHGGHRDRPPLFRVTALFKEVKGKTHLSLSFALPTVEAAEETRKFIKKAGGESTWDRLAEYLADVDGKDHFVINRSFDVPIARMFEMWTDPKHLSQWLPPTGFTSRFMRADIRPGGESFYEMTDGKAVTMYGKAHYVEVVRPNRVVYTQIFVDAQERISRHPMAPTWPETMKTTVQFTEEASDRTRVTVTWEVYGPATRDEIETFKKARAGMTQGWTGSFDKLEEYLERD